MKKQLLLAMIPFLFSALIFAQESKSASWLVSLKFYNLGDRAFIGPKLDIFEMFNIGSRGWKIGLGGEPGCLYSRVNNDKLQPLVFDRVFEFFEFHPDYKSEGNLFMIPIEGYLLVGHKEDFLIVGGGLQWLQFMGKNHYEAQGKIHTYRIHEPNFLYSLNIGYRHIPSDKGVGFEISWKPNWFMIDDKYYGDGFSLALGYRF